MMNHEEAFELLAPLALDALDVEGEVNVEQHVATCPRCQHELDELRDVAAAMGNGHESVPDGLWEKISSSLYEHEGTDVNVVPELALAGFASPLASPARRVSVTRRVKAVMVTVALAAAAAIVALGLNLASANNHVTNLQQAIGSGHEAVLSALATPGHKIVNLRNANDLELAKFVMLPDGRGYLVSSSMPKLPSGKTYQLWGFVKGSPVSIGVMGSSPTTVDFTMASSPAPSGLAVTIEPAGGSLTPAKTLVATGTV